ncbi:GNAT family N-acetyltransferase [Mycobacterium sp. 21AC1]|uniref:GNAT family N-acetyltransferase n=1 Tax=[Mycobacterium] appelbergii TaxID=2939269 RepID=UPI002938D68A|nr:GNAT family N-acetyltransferase [Mycobacterium sp. 21AC1]MDV3126033.1 GNAT family N-acetyltransferase [Mycobacterium sp. 21AC1]
MTDSQHSYQVRAAVPSDFDLIIEVVDDWWGRPASRDLTRLFLDHFHDTSLIASTPELPLAGFVIGFLSPAQPDAAYIHFTGVHPVMRRTGLARDLYNRFFEMARKAGRTKVKAITSPVNARSIAFHQAIGFDASEPIVDYDGPTLDRVVFQRSP